MTGFGRKSRKGKKMKGNKLDQQFNCKDCGRFPLCRYYHRRKKESEICHYFHLFPDNPTNGDVIEAVFPNVSIYKHGSTYSINNEYNFNETWWDAPYKREVEE